MDRFTVGRLLAMVVVTSALLVAWGGCTSRALESPAAESTSTPASLQPTRTSATPAVTSCDRLIGEGWEPSEFDDFDVSSDPRTGIAVVTIGRDRLVLDIRNDPACRRLPTLGPVIARLVEEQEANGRVVVPELVGERPKVARARARDLGLRTQVLNHTGTACLPRGVIDQRPTAGREVAAGRQVLLVLNPGGFGKCGLDLPPASADLRRIADLFVDFARSADPDHPGPPADTPIDLYIGGVLERVIPAVRIPDRRQWRACPAGIGYAARRCPISVLAPFRHYPGPIAATGQAPSHPCAHPAALPSTLDVYRSATLTPDEALDCTSYFAVQLFVNDVGQIVALNLVLAEP